MNYYKARQINKKRIDAIDKQITNVLLSKRETRDLIEERRIFYQANKELTKLINAKNIDWAYEQ